MRESSGWAKLLTLTNGEGRTVVVGVDCEREKRREEEDYEDLN